MRAALALAVGFLVLLVGGGARFAIGLTFKPMVDEFGWARGELGLAVGLYMVVSAVATFIAGPHGRPAQPARAADRRHGDRRRRHRGDEPRVRSRGTRSSLYGVVFAIGNGAASLVIIGVIVMRAYPGRAGIANAVAISGMSVGQLVMIALLAAVLVQIGWRSVFVWIGVAHLVLLPLLLATAGAGRRAGGRRGAARGPVAARGGAHAAVLAAACDLRDLRARRFLRHHACGGVRAGPRPRRAVRRQPAGADGADRPRRRDRGGPGQRSLRPGRGRRPPRSWRASSVFAWIAIDQSPLSIAVFALVFGATFLVTAPLTVVFVRESFGTQNLGALAGLITMVHQIFGGLGAYAGAAIFDATGGYDAAFVVHAGLVRRRARAHADAAARRAQRAQSGLHAGLADDALVLLALRLHERGELLDRLRRHVGARIDQLLARRRIGEDLVDLAR